MCQPFIGPPEKINATDLSVMPSKLINITWTAPASFNCDIFYQLKVYSSQDPERCDKTVSNITGTSHTLIIPQECDINAYVANISGMASDGRTSSPVSISLDG